ncbi:FecCD family ABC transporter permease [Chitinimonas lacunae]|uniref:FecCD family ABC transporter permease n=1 Tax=Chitinimonas lacunae TaxID=1963018 RepID=A0ABV8ML01_9NEIS
MTAAPRLTRPPVYQVFSGSGPWLMLLAGLGLIGFAFGFHGDGWQWPDLNDPLFNGLRLPRLLSALLVGAALAGAGAALQALFRNPLVDPGMIGTSSGAMLGAIGVMALGWDSMGMPFAAFVGGLAVTWLLLLFNRLLDGGELGLLVLGLVIGSFASAVCGLVLFLSDDLTLRGATTWLSGHLGNSAAAPLWLAAPVSIAGLLILWWQGRDLDCLLLGEDEAISLGIDLPALRRWTALGAALAVGGAVTLAGLVGFVGMMVPNACALWLGGSRRRLIGISAVVGAVFLLGMDTLARGAVYPVDLPVGLLAALVGPPFFLWLFLRRRGER